MKSISKIEFYYLLKTVIFDLVVYVFFLGLWHAVPISVMGRFLGFGSTILYPLQSPPLPSHSSSLRATHLRRIAVSCSPIILFGSLWIRACMSFLDTVVIFRLLGNHSFHHRFTTLFTSLLHRFSNSLWLIWSNRSPRIVGVVYTGGDKILQVGMVLFFRLRFTLRLESSLLILGVLFDTLVSWSYPHHQLRSTSSTIQRITSIVTLQIRRCDERHTHTRIATVFF